MLCDPNAQHLSSISTGSDLRPELVFIIDNVKEEVHYQGRWDLRAQTTCKHVTPITVLKDRIKMQNVSVSQEAILNSVTLKKLN